MLKQAAERIIKFLESDSALHAYQREILLASAVDLNQGKWGGVLCEPTGVGKTIIMGAEIKALGYDAMVRHNFLALLVSPAVSPKKYSNN